MRNVPLFVVYNMVDDEVYRIISARKALKAEVERYYYAVDTKSVASTNEIAKVAITDF